MHFFIPSVKQSIIIPSVSISGMQLAVPLRVCLRDSAVPPGALHGPVGPCGLWLPAREAAAPQEPAVGQ